MSTKRKKTSLSQSSQSGSETSERSSKHGATKKWKEGGSSSGSSDEGSGKSRSGSDSGTARSGSESRGGSKHSRKSNSSKSSESDSGTEGSDRPVSRKASSGSSSGNSSSGSEKLKKLKKASSRKPSSKMEASALSHDSDSDEEQKLEKGQSRKGESRGRSKSGSSDEETWKDNFDDGLNDMLIGDENDKKMLEEMTEKEREEELFKRTEKREELKKRFEITKKLEKQQKNIKKEEEREEGEINDNNSDEDKRFDVQLNCRKKKYEEKYDKKFSALSELKAKREEKERKDAIRKEKESIKKKPSDSESGSDLEKLAIKQSTQKKVLKASDVYSSSSDDGKDEERRKSSSSSNSSSSVSSISSGESDTERHMSKKLVKKAQILETLDQLEQIRLSRFKIEKFVHLPIFKRTAIGCFVRIGIGNDPTHQTSKPVYRVAEIVEICETAKTYSVGNVRTNIGLKLRHSKEERVFRVAFVSNQQFTESEFNKWKYECEKANVELPNVQAIATKASDIDKALNYRFSSADVDKILASKGKFAVNPVNYAVHKAKLQKEKLQCQEMGNDEEAERVTKKLMELEERAEELDKKRTSSISAISLINDRNRKANIIKAEKAINEEMRKKKIDGNDDEDPFTRRKTAPKLPSAKKDENDQEMTSELLLKLQQEKNEEEKNRKEEAEKKMPKPLEIKVPKGVQNKPAFKNDLFDAHDFDVEINVSEIQQNSIPASINLKPVTSSAKTSNGPTKRALKIDEWKKKRGII